MRRALAFVAFAILAGSVLAQTAERPSVRVGDEWKFVVYYSVPSRTPNRSWVVTAVTPTAIVGTENGEPLTLTADLGVAESPLVKYSNPRTLSFPLEVGKRWRYASDWVFKPKGSNGSTVVEVTVLGHERIRVPAGEFEAFRLLAKGSLSGTSPSGSFYAGETTTTYWYAPDARAIVKSVYHNPYQGISTVELVEFRRARP